MGSSVRTVAREQLLMVHYNHADNTVVLRTVNELQSPGEIKYGIPYRDFCGFTLFQGWLIFIDKEKWADAVEIKLNFLWAYIHGLQTVFIDNNGCLLMKNTFLT